MMRNVLPPRVISFTPTIESCAGIPLRIGSSGGCGLEPPLNFFFLLDRAAILWPSLAQGLKTILVIGCTSQTVGMRLFKLLGPGRVPFA